MKGQTNSRERLKIDSYKKSKMIIEKNYNFFDGNLLKDTLSEILY